MNFVGLFRQEHVAERGDRDQENASSDPVLAELSPPPLEDEPDFDIELEDALTEALAVPADANSDGGMDPAEDAGEAPAESGGEHRITPHSQTRLAALSAFEDLTQSTRQDLQALGLTLAKVTSTQQLMRGFLTAIHADIHRANELELSLTRSNAENRRLSHQLEETQRQLSAREAANDQMENRIAKLTQEGSALRDALSEARLEAGDSAKAIADLEAERAELTTSLASKTLSVEKLLRENEVMREKQANLSIDLDGEIKAHADTRRRLEEMSAAHNSDAARIAELLAKVAHGEKEMARLQKQHDSLQANVDELNETVSGLETELAERATRHAAEVAEYESDIQALNSRLQESSRTIGQKSEQIDALTAKLNEEASEKKVALERLESMRAEHERDKQQLSAAFANFSQLNVLQTSEHVMLDLHKHEAEELRRQVGNLEATIKRIAPQEKALNGKAPPAKKPAEEAVKRDLAKEPAKGAA